MIRLRTITASFLFVISIFPLHAEAAFQDTAGHPHALYIEHLAEKGVLQGYDNGLFRPDFPVNRAEFLKVTMAMAFGDYSWSLANVACFTDFYGGLEWYWPYACVARQKGIISGYPDGTFRGASTVNLAEALKIATEALDLELTTVEAGQSWYAPYMQIALERGVFENYTRNPAHLLTRSDMVYILVTLSNPDFPGSNPSPNPNPNPTPQICGNGTLEAPEQCDDGNLENGDGCSSICVLVPEPVRHGALRIDERSVSAFTVSPGAKNLELFAFDAIAARQTVTLSSVTLQADSGSLSIVDSFTLLADLDGNGDAETLLTEASAEGNTVVFDAFELDIADGQLIHLSVKGDLKQSIGSQELSLGFAVSDPRFVEAVGKVDGRDLSGITLDGVACSESVCWIQVYTATSPSFTVGSRGNLYVSADSTPVRSHQLLAGTVSPDILRLKVRSEGEDIELSDLAFSGIPSTVDRLEILAPTQNFSGEDELLSTARLSACSTPTFGVYCLDSPIMFEAEKERTLKVRAVLKADTEGGKSGESFHVTVLSAAGNNQAEATGLSSSEVLGLSDGDTLAEGELFIGTAGPAANADIISSTHDTLLAALETIESTHPDADGTPVPSGDTNIGRFGFKAFENQNLQSGSNDVIIDDITFTVQATNVSLDSTSFALFHTNAPSILHPCSGFATSGTISVVCSNLTASSVCTVLDSAASLQLGLQATVTNAQVSPGHSSLQVSLKQLSDRNTTCTIRFTDEISTFDWVDVPFTEVKSVRYTSH